MKLYEITSELRQLLEIDDQEYYLDTIEALELEFEQKVDGIACYIKELQSECEAIKLEEKNLNERRKVKETKIESLKIYVMNEMKAVGKKKIETTRNVLSIRKTAQSIKFENEKELIDRMSKENDNRFLKYSQPTLDKTKIKEYIKDGGNIDGVWLEAGESFNLK